MVGRRRLVEVENVGGWVRCGWEGGGVSRPWDKQSIFPPVYLTSLPPSIFPAPPTSLLLGHALKYPLPSFLPSFLPILFPSIIFPHTDIPHPVSYFGFLSSGILLSVSTFFIFHSHLWLERLLCKKYLIHQQIWKKDRRINSLMYTERRRELEEVADWRTVLTYKLDGLREEWSKVLAPVVGYGNLHVLVTPTALKHVGQVGGHVDDVLLRGKRTYG